MKIYYYVHTGHRIGLDRFRRAAAIIRALGDVDITLLASDYRIAGSVKEYGVKRGVGVDVVQNIAHIAERGDILIYDSDEHNPTTLDDMTHYFSKFIRISDSPDDTKHPREYLINPYLKGEGICNDIVIDDAYFYNEGENDSDFEKKYASVFFFGDNDYDKNITANLSLFEGLEFDLLLGFYFFFDYEKELAPAFGNLFENEEYDEVIRHSRVLLTSSPQAALENLAAGGCPVFLQRPDYVRDFLPIFDKFQIPVVDGFDRAALTEILEKIMSHKYNRPEKSTQKVTQFIRSTLNL